MPYFYLWIAWPRTSLQLADGSEKNPFGILEDVPVKVGNFCVLNDFIIVDMAGEAYTKIVLGRPFLATFGCKINVKGGQLTFDVGTCDIKFNFCEDQIATPALFLSDEVPNSHEIEMDDVWCYIDPTMFDWFLLRILTLTLMRWSLLPLYHLA